MPYFIFSNFKEKEKNEEKHTMRLLLKSVTLDHDVFNLRNITRNRL